MAELTKEQERAELHRAIWAIADELRGSVDGWDFKNYVLGMMFYRYISESLTSYINAGEIEAGNVDFDYAQLSDKEAEEARDGLIQEQGFFMLPSELFCNVRSKAVNDENLNMTLEQIFNNIEESAKDYEVDCAITALKDVKMQLRNLLIEQKERPSEEVDAKIIKLEEKKKALLEFITESED